MLINDSEFVIPKEDLYFCYSLNLHRFLKDDKEIYHINCGLNKKTNKMWFTYYKTDYLKECLKEWSLRKVTNNLYIVRSCDDNEKH